MTLEMLSEGANEGPAKLIVDLLRWSRVTSVSRTDGDHDFRYECAALPRLESTPETTGVRGLISDDETSVSRGGGRVRGTSDEYLLLDMSALY